MSITAISGKLPQIGFGTVSNSVSRPLTQIVTAGKGDVVTLSRDVLPSVSKAKPIFSKIGAGLKSTLYGTRYLIGDILGKRASFGMGIYTAYVGFTPYGFAIIPASMAITSAGLFVTKLISTRPNAVKTALGKLFRFRPKVAIS